jgi:hypothetical protein
MAKLNKKWNEQEGKFQYFRDNSPISLDEYAKEADGGYYQALHDSQNPEDISYLQQSLSQHEGTQQTIDQLEKRKQSLTGGGMDAVGENNSDVASQFEQGSSADNSLVGSSGAFSKALSQMNAKQRENKDLEKQRDALLSYLSSGDPNSLSEEQKSKMTPDQINAINSDNLFRVAKSMREVTDVMEGRGKLLDSSLQFLQSGYQQKIQNVMQQRRAKESMIRTTLQNAGLSFVKNMPQETKRSLENELLFPDGFFDAVQDEKEYQREIAEQQRQRQQESHELKKKRFAFQKEKFNKNMAYKYAQLNKQYSRGGGSGSQLSRSDFADFSKDLYSEKPTVNGERVSSDQFVHHLRMQHPQFPVESIAKSVDKVHGGVSNELMGMGDIEHHPMDKTSNPQASSTVPAPDTSPTGEEESPADPNTGGDSGFLDTVGDALGNSIRNVTSF